MALLNACQLFTTAHASKSFILSQKIDFQVLYLNCSENKEIRIYSRLFRWVRLLYIIKPAGGLVHNVMVILGHCVYANVTLL